MRISAGSGKTTLELAPAWDLARDQMFRLRMAHADLVLTP